MIEKIVLKIHKVNLGIVFFFKLVFSCNTIPIFPKVRCIDANL